MGSEELAEALEAMQERRYDDAIRILDHVLKRDPSNSKAHDYMRSALATIGEIKKAIEGLDEMLQPMEHELLIGSLANRENPNEIAKQMPTETLRAFTENSIIKASLLTALGRFDEAEECYDRALHAWDKITIPIQWAIFKAVARTGIPPTVLVRERLDLQERLETLEALQVGIWVAKARLAARKKRFQDSIEHSETAISLDRLDPEAWNIKAFAQLQLGRLDEAVESARKALSLKPDYTNAWKTLAEAYGRKGDKEQALECAENARKHGPAGDVIWRKPRRSIRDLWGRL